MATATVPYSGSAKRRSSRIALNAAVGLSGQDRRNQAFSLSAQATNLNKYGAAIAVTRELGVGTTVLVRNKRGTQVSARIVAQVSAVEGVHTYGIEFTDEDIRATGFWGITFPSNA
jgi:hypothetical protein